MSDREVVVKASAFFVPVAVNLYVIRDEQSPGGDLFRAARRQRDEYQGLWLIAPDGRVLATQHKPRSHATWTAEVRAAIDAALAASGPITPRAIKRGDDALKFRGQGIREDGSVSLALSSRFTYNGKPEGDGAYDNLTLPAADWPAFLPPDVAPGTSWTLPERVARAFSRALSPTSDQSTMPKPEEVTACQLVGRVVANDGKRVKLVYLGQLSTAHLYQGKRSTARMRFTGLGTYNLAARSLRSITIVGEGIFRPAPPYTEDRPIAAAIEWRLSPADDRLDAQPAR